MAWAWTGLGRGLGRAWTGLGQGLEGACTGIERGFSESWPGFCIRFSLAEAWVFILTYHATSYSLCIAETSLYGACTGLGPGLDGAWTGAWTGVGQGLDGIWTGIDRWSHESWPGLCR